MAYSEEEMRSLILGLAENADPLEADALRSVAANYKPEPKPKETFPELSFWQAAALGILVFLVWTPIAFYFARGSKPLNEPTGTEVEQLTGFTPASNGFWKTRTYKFVPQEDFSSGVRKFTFEKDPVPLVVYEDQKPLPKANYEFQQINPANIWRFVSVKPTDGTDPNTNGHQYYAVMP